MYKNSTIKANDIAGALRKKHKKDMCFEELRGSSGFNLASRVDFYALNVAPSTGNRATAYEIKVSKADFKRDNHGKQRAARLFSDQFFYIAPKGVIPHDDVPDWAGLIEVDWHCHNFKGAKPYLRLKEVVPAPKRDKDAPSWGLLVSMLRNDRRQHGISTP